MPEIDTNIIEPLDKVEGFLINKGSRNIADNKKVYADICYSFSRGPIFKNVNTNGANDILICVENKVED